MFTICSHRQVTDMPHKGALTPGQIDRNWPHQVALEASQVMGRTDIIEPVKRELGGSPLGHTVRRDDIDYVVFCFRKRESADSFRARFGGEPFDPRERGKGTVWSKWKRPTPPSIHPRG